MRSRRRQLGPAGPPLEFALLPNRETRNISVAEALAPSSCVPRSSSGPNPARAALGSFCPLSRLKEPSTLSLLRKAKACHMQNRSPDFLPQINARQSPVIHFTQICFPPSPFRSSRTNTKVWQQCPCCPAFRAPVPPPPTRHSAEKRGGRCAPPQRDIPTPQRYAEATPSHICRVCVCIHSPCRPGPVLPPPSRGPALPDRGGRSAVKCSHPRGTPPVPSPICAPWAAGSPVLPLPPPPPCRRRRRLPPRGRQLTGARAEQIFFPRVNFGASRGAVRHRTRAERRGRREAGGGSAGRLPAAAGRRRRKGAFFSYLNHAEYVHFWFLLTLSGGCEWQSPFCYNVTEYCASEF